jgi:hypothetical protein
VRIDLPRSWDTPVPVVRFADGGILPGYTPGRDVHRFVSPSGGVLDLSGGEPILRPEVGKVVGHGWVEGVNKAARTGGIPGVRAFLHTETPTSAPAHHDGAGNGFGDLLRVARDKATDVISGIGSFMTDPAGTLRRLADKLIALVPGGNSMVGKATAAMPRKVAAALVNTVKRIFTGVEGRPRSPGGIGSANMMRILRARFPGLPMNSGYRPGSITATGNLSYHAMTAANGEPGRAVDVPPMWPVFRYLHAAFPDTRELIFSPAGNMQIWNGRPHYYTGVTRQDHFDHIHWALRNGGILPRIYDDGGYLPPGLSVVANGTGRPEPVFTDRQWAQISSLNQHAETRNTAAQYHFAFRDTTLTAGRLRAMQDRDDALNRVHRAR